MLFHYHHWTPYLEETEKYYLDLGFQVNQRLGKYKGQFQAFNPPLRWDDFREKNILFRIIEMKKGNVNITFGYGKRVLFDHIGFLVSDEDHDVICRRVQNVGWSVQLGERRTFLQTPYGLSIELQTHNDVIELDNNPSTIQKMKIQTKKQGFVKELSQLFQEKMDAIETTYGDKVILEEVCISNILQERTVDPNGLLIKRPSI